MLVKNTQLRYSGYSLIELIITITLTSIVMVIFYTVFGQNQVKSVSTVIQVKAAELGQAYLEEISLKKYDENSPEGNAVRCNSGTPALDCTPEASLGNEELNIRQLFDDIDDYHNLSDKPPVDAFGIQRTGFNGFFVTVTVEYAGTDFGFAQQDMKKIVVTVTPPASHGGQFIFTEYKGNF